jgi:PQQ-dependent dehydrogenase (s-GDH family)
MVRPRILAVLVIAALAAPAVQSQSSFSKRVVTDGLREPFQIVWGPDDYLWVTERTAGRVTRVHPSDGSKTPAITISNLLTDGPGGLLGMALDPGLLKGTGSDFVYVAYTYDADSDPGTISRRTRIVRFNYDAQAHTLGNPRDVIAGLPAGTDHQGGRLVFGPDGKLYFTIGDLGANQLANFCKPDHAQSIPTVAQIQARDWSLYEGKVLRLNLDGSIPSDNPTIGGVRSHVFSYGRAWTEHRRRGQFHSCGDELRMAARRRI